MILLKFSLDNIFCNPPLFEVLVIDVGVDSEQPLEDQLRDGEEVAGEGGPHLEIKLIVSVRIVKCPALPFYTKA